MKIIDTYSILQKTLALNQAHPVFQAWGYTQSELLHWMNVLSTPSMRETAQNYLTEVNSLVQRVESHFATELLGELVLIPSMGEVDGFARYDRGHHTVMLGIDFPDASIDYLRALTAHELSHVYRDHAPAVWSFLGKPLTQIHREEYLEATSGREHLVSEGLATLNSQAVFPDVPLHDHHYYSPEEMQWCLENETKIHRALMDCLATEDPDPWQFYRPGRIARGAPSYAHYFWAARQIDKWIKQTPGMTLVKAHTLPATEIKAF